MSKALELSQLANDITYTEGTDTLSFGQANITIGSNALLSYNTFSGDLTVASNGAVTLATVNSNVGSFGSGSAIPVVTVNGKGLVTAVSTQSVNIVTTTDIAGDSGTDTITLGTDTLTFAGGTGLTSAVTNNNVSIALDNTAVSAGSYGGATAIPVITIDAQGRITSASTSSINTDLVSDTTPQLGGNLDINSNDITGTGNISITGDFTLTSTDTGGADDPSIILKRNSSSPANFDNLGNIDFVGENDASQEVTYSSISGMANDVTDGTEDGRIRISTMVNGSLVDHTDFTQGFIEFRNEQLIRWHEQNGSYASQIDGGTPTANRTITVPDATGTIALTSDIPSNTDGLTEGSSNLYFTDARADARITNALGGNVTITGDLTVNGTTTTVNSNTVNIGDNIIVLNSDETGTPSQNGGIEIERGTSTNVSLRFNETTDKWQFTNDGTTYNNLGTSDIVNDTTPQLGGDLDNNGKNIKIGASSTGTGNNRFIVGPNNEFQIYHNASLGTYMVESGTGSLRFMASDLKLQNFAGSHEYIVMTDGGSVAISHGNGKKLETTTTGVTVTGTVAATAYTGDGSALTGISTDYTVSANHAFRQISDGSNQAVADSNIDTFTVTAGTDISAVVTPASDTLTIANTSTLDSVTTRGATTNTSILFPDNVKARFGDTSSPDMEIYHDGLNSYIDDTGTGSIFIRSGTTYIQNAAGTKTAFATNSGAEQTLYHNNSPKFSTSATGVSVTGTVAATAYTGDGSALTGIDSAHGGGTDHAFLETDNTINSSYSISSNRNAMTVGPVTVASGATITVPSGQRWIIM